MVNRVVKFAEIRKEAAKTCPGNRIQDVYKLTYNDDGTKTLVVSEKIDIVEQIQSHADSVDLHQIIARCTMTGDYSPLNKQEGMYGDLTIMPKTRVEALQAMAEAENVWKTLPAKVKEKFSNDVNQFFASAFSKEWIEKMTIEKEPDEKIVEPGAIVKENADE